MCLNKITNPPVLGSQGPYKDWRATDDDYYDKVLNRVHRNSLLESVPIRSNQVYTLTPCVRFSIMLPSLIRSCCRSLCLLYPDRNVVCGRPGFVLTRGEM
jgi:hypothetical protein